jgi:hypothetical protein
MSKIGVAVGEDFPLQDLPSDSPEKSQAEADRGSQAACGENREGQAEDDVQSECARWKWRREGQRLWDEDVRNQRADWEARKRAFKEKIGAAIRDAVHANENQRHHRWRHSWRSAWPSVVGIGIAALALAIHRHSHNRRAGGCRYYDDSDIETPPHAPQGAPPPDRDDPIITPPPPREH